MVVGIEQGAYGYLGIVGRTAGKGKDHLLSQGAPEGVLKLVQTVAGVGNEAFSKGCGLVLQAHVKGHPGLERHRGVTAEIINAFRSPEKVHGKA